MASGSHAERIDPEALTDPALVSAWRELAELRENPFLTPDWYRASIEARDEEPFAIAWRVGGEIRGVLPLVRTSRGPLKLLRFAGARRGDWFSPACRPADEGDMAEACAPLLLAERMSWQLIRLDRVDAGCAWPTALAAGGGIAVVPRRRPDVLPYIQLGEGGFEAYLASRSRNFRSQLNRRRRRLERDHGLAFRMTSTSQELDADLDVFWRLHDERWRDRGGSSSAIPAARRHLRLFAAAALERGWLRLWTAVADGEPAASWYGWRIGGRYCYSLAGLSRRFERHGLGTVLLAHTIEQAAAEGVTVYDLMWGDEDYKRRFETGRRHAVTWLLSRSRHPIRPAVSFGMQVARAGDELPPALRRPLKRLAGTVRRS
ncbi:MAG TPA: GNAT family N-acetyltransferase [Solirubrobacterales bacterium]|nr:GNAT family N-acetyltransferase [Solirubrobacterales bacterium]